MEFVRYFSFLKMRIADNEWRCLEKSGSPEWNQIIDNLTAEVKTRRYSRKTLKAYADWSRKFQGFLHNKPPDELPERRCQILSDVSGGKMQGVCLNATVMSKSTPICHSRNPESFRESGILLQTKKDSGQAPLEAQLHTGQAGMTDKKLKTKEALAKVQFW
jgi:hypothetical protein